MISMLVVQQKNRNNTCNHSVWWWRSITVIDMVSVFRIKSIGFLWAKWYGCVQVAHCWRRLLVSSKCVLWLSSGRPVFVLYHSYKSPVTLKPLLWSRTHLFRTHLFQYIWSSSPLSGLPGGTVSVSHSTGKLTVKPLQGHLDCQW